MKTLTGKGFEFLVEAGAGVPAQFSDSDYAAAGAKIVQTGAKDLFSQSDMILKVRPPSAEKEIDLLRDKSALVSFVYPAQNKVSKYIYGFPKCFVNYWINTSFFLGLGG